MTVHPIPDPNAPWGDHEICNWCGCFWNAGDEPQTKDEWCAEPLRGAGCACHEEVLAVIEDVPV